MIVQKYNNPQIIEVYLMGFIGQELRKLRIKQVFIPCSESYLGFNFGKIAYHN
jgi:hypothetical protein